MNNGDPVSDREEVENQQRGLFSDLHACAVAYTCLQIYIHTLYTQGRGGGGGGVRERDPQISQIPNIFQSLMYNLPRLFMFIVG